MTQARLNVPAGQITKQGVTTSAGASIGTDICRLSLDDATATKEQVLLALEVLKQRIQQSAWPL